MDRFSSKLKILTLIIVCSFLFLPSIAPAEEYRDLGTVQFGPGTGSETFYLGAEVRSMTAAPVLKSLIISVQNGSAGSKKGKDRVSSAVVAVNGQEIFTQKNFNRNVVSSLTRTIDVDDPGMKEVLLDVKVNGHKNVYLSATLTAVYEEVILPPVQVLWFLDTDEPPNGIGGPITGIGTVDTPPLPDSRGIWVPVGGDIQ